MQTLGEFRMMRCDINSQSGIWRYVGNRKHTSSMSAKRCFASIGMLALTKAVNSWGASTMLAWAG